MLPEPCEPQVEIPRSPGEVPHYLPGANPYLAEFPKLYNLPLEAARGGARTTYPEYGKALRSTYKAPDKCTVYCCGGTTLTVMNNSQAALPHRRPAAGAASRRRTCGAAGHTAATAEVGSKAAYFTEQFSPSCRQPSTSSTGCS